MAPSRFSHFALPAGGSSVSSGLLCLAACLLLSIGCRNADDSGAGHALSESTHGVHPSPSDLAQQLDRAVQARDWATALRVADRAMIASPDDPHVLTNAAIARAGAGRRVEAAKLLVDAARASQFAPGVRIDNAFRALLDVGRLHDAIELLENVLEQHPTATAYRRRLVGFLGEAQLDEKVGVHMERLIRDRQIDLPLLLATTESSSRRFSPKTIDALVKKNPQDLRPRLGHAKALLSSRNPEDATRVLREIVDRHPDFAAGQAMLGAALVAAGKNDQLPSWHAGLPTDTSQYSGYWVAMGQWALASGQTTAAVRAFAEATRRSPNDSGIWARLGGAVRRLGAEDSSASSKPPDRDVDLETIAAAIDKRRTDLLRLSERFAKFRISEYRSQQVAVDIARALLDLGRLWEAEAWLAAAGQLPDQPSKELIPLRDEVIRRLSADRQWQSRRGHPELAFDLESFPLPRDLGDDSSSRIATRRTNTLDPRAIRLSEEARPRGLEFYGSVGDRVAGPKVPIHQTLGCGGGVIDVDHDGRHDLAFAAAGGTIRGTDSDPGALYRNIGGRFVDVSGPAGFADRGFGHGIVVGDYNDDGFQDIVVLNLGRNRLLRNNGDGTFSDASMRLAETGSGQWSTSGAMADVDGDGYSDLVIVNYCDADQPLDEPCFDSGGREVNCFPLRYRAGRDRFLRGTEEGRFRDVTDRWAPQPSMGRGLGIVAGRLDGQVQAVYVTNDASINHLYRWIPDARGSGGLIESGVASGLAVDAQSLDQGSMGIASGDFDGDGDLDFYVTGFNQEYNIYYDQTSPGFWADQTAALGMVSSTRNMVGFGTEAIDFDNDGQDELLVSNGHIGDFGAGSSPYAQPLQLFRAAAEGGYELLDLGSWGQYFASPHVGRALLTFDADQDGRTDVVVTHATEPVALLMNRSDPQHHRIAFRLVGTRQTRDAVGAVLQFDMPSESTWRLFRLSGHGYLVSNQPELVAGTGSADMVHEVQVTWPDGQRQSLGDLETDAEYLLVRGQPPFRLRKYR